MALEVSEHGHLRPEPLAPLLGDRLPRAFLEQIALRQREHARQRGEARVVGGELALDRLVVDDRVRLLALADRGRDVEHVHEQPGALDVGEEVVAEAGAFARALDQARDVGDDELAVLGVEHAEHGRERREGVVRDLRRRAGEAREQRGLARVRQPDEADVGEQLQPQLDPARLAGQPALGEPRRLAGGRGEALVALAARAAARGERALPVREQLPAPSGEVLALAVGREASVPGGTRISSVSPSAPWRWEPSAVAAAAGAEVARAPEGLQVAQRGVADEQRRRRRARRRRRRARREGRALRGGSSSSRRRRRRPRSRILALSWSIGQS